MAYDGLKNIYHPLFYTSNIIIVDRFLKRCFQNHIGWWIIPTTITPSLYVCQLYVAFLKNWNGRVVSWPQKAGMSANEVTIVSCQQVTNSYCSYCELQWNILIWLYIVFSNKNGFSCQSVTVSRLLISFFIRDA